MRKRIINIILTLILLTGLSLLLYPSVSNWWNRHYASRAITNYAEWVEAISPEEYERMWAEAEAYNEALMERAVRFNPTEEEHEQYLSVLNVGGDEVMGYIQIPSINVSLPIYHGVDDAVLQIAAGHIEGTSLPIGGPGTHCVISGHRGLPSAKLFTDLDKLVEGDVFMLNVLHETLTYQVDQILIVLPEEVNDLQVEPGRDYCTLVTCTPYGVNTHRMLVRGHRIDNLPEAKEIIVESEAELIEPLIVAAGLAVPMLLVLLIGIMIPKKRR